MLSALGASVEIAGPQRRRRVDIAAFIKGAFATDLDDGETLTALHLALLVRRSGSR